MKKIWLYLVLTTLIFLAVIPPINFFISRPENDLWFVMVLMMGFFGFYTIHIKTNTFVPIIAIGSLALCVLCGSPLIALTSYFSIVLCCYLYIFAQRITDWQTVFKFFQTLLFLNAFILGLQFFGKDTLLNFGLGKNLNTYGIIGQHMQMGSFSVVLSAILLQVNPMYLLFPLFTAIFCLSAWTLAVVICATAIITWPKSKNLARAILLIGGMAFLVYAFHNGKFESNIKPNNGRLMIWKTSLQIANKHPWVGWGPGTYKVLYPPLSRQKLYPGGFGDPNNIPYRTAHNWIVQMVFEMGYPFTAFILFIILWIGYGLYKVRDFNCLAGLTMIFLDGLVHFPDRMLQTVGMVIIFIAFCIFRLMGSRV